MLPWGTQQTLSLMVERRAWEEGTRAAGSSGLTAQGAEDCAQL